MLKMESPKKQFQDALNKAYLQDPSVSREQDNLDDLLKYTMTTEAETDEATGTASSGDYSAPLFGDMKEDEEIPGGKAKGMSLEDIAQKHHKDGSKFSVNSLIKMLEAEMVKGIRVEMEHTKNIKIAMEIAKDHLYEDPKYYTKLKKIEESRVEAVEATGTASTGSYSTPAFVAKKGKWRGGKKTLYKGGKFVQVKKKCMTFPYCNQGNTGAVKYSNKETLENAIKEASKRTGVSESMIKKIVLSNLDTILNKQK
jgi:hypothetical protein